MQSKLTRKLAQKGFTLIELIITIVIIGILAAVAIPKFQNLSAEANVGVAKGAAAAVASATSVNYSRRAGGSTGGYAIADCDAIQTNLTALADVPSGTVVSGTGTLPTNGTTGECTLTVGTGAAAAATTFKAYGTL